MSSSGGIGSTLTGGIQDIAGLLPLLGTEQCSVQVSSALTNGYLYAAASPMSIFGSLGVVSAGFKTLIACLSFGDIEGAKILGNMGFEPLGENLRLVMVEADKGKNAGRYIIENRIDELVNELNIDENRIIGVSHKSAAWNLKMIAMTALLCAFSISPYIFLNLGANNLTKSTTWIFPVLRSTGGFITATLIQLTIQRRITILSDHYLVKRNQQFNPDVEAAIETKKHQIDPPIWLLSFLLLIGIVASVVGYVGCFSVVQNSTSTFGPVSWLCLETGLSVMRLALWAWNPTKDDAPPLEIILELDKYENSPFPTCNKSNKDILQSAVLPLIRAQDFLKIITSFTGFIEPFYYPDISLYYTLTWKLPSEKSVPADIENIHQNRNNQTEDEEKHKLGERILYITFFDHKERTARVYTRDNEIDSDTLYSTKSNAPIFEDERFRLHVEIGEKMYLTNADFFHLLRKHHRSILENIHYRLGTGYGYRTYAIENCWTMKVVDAISTLDRLRIENEADWREVVEKGKEKGRNEESLLICDYFMHPSIERERGLLSERRVKWVARRMDMITKDTKERLEGGMGVEYRVNNQAVKKPTTTSRKEMEEMLAREQYFMDLLLLYEVMEWEQFFWNKFKAFLDQIGNDRVEEKGRMTREWKGNYGMRRRIIDLVLKRLVDFDEKGWFPKFLEEKKVSMDQLFEWVENPNVGILSQLREEIEPLDNEIRLRMEKEIEDTQFRLKRGYDLGRFDQFWDDDSLFECRYSRSKWLYLRISSTVPLDIYSHALKGNKNITHITFSHVGSDSDVDRFQSTVCDDLPWVTSVSFGPQQTLPAIHRDLPFIKSSNNDLITFGKEIRPKLDPDSTYIFTDAGHSDMSLGRPDGIVNDARVLISFVAPTSGQSLILRIKHSGKESGPLEVTLGSAVIQLNPSSQSSLTIDDLTLYPIPGHSEFDRLSFEPGSRNDIVIKFRGSVEERDHILHDVELLDEAGREYYPRNAL